MSFLPPLPPVLRAKGFTLVEVLVATVIVSILMMLTLRSLSTLMDQKNRVVCASNLRNIFVAISAYGVSNDGNMPSNNSKTSWWKEIYPAYCSSKAVFACPADRTGYADPADGDKGKLSYGPLGWDSASDSSSAFNKKLSSFASPAKSIVLAEYFSAKRLVSGISTWQYPGTVANATYPHYAKTKTSLLFLDGHIECESEAEIREKLQNKEIINSF
jgi:prepilin-type N-terminal cleavage/methylation domain-containing protein